MTGGRYLPGRPAGKNRTPQDQVTRRLAFSAAHPEVGITVNSRMGRWEATCPDGPAGTREIRRIELKDLLDTLEERYGHPRE